MPKGYHHLTYAQRCQISILKDRGESQATIANELGVHSTTIGRKLRRNSGQRGYRYNQAHEKSQKRRLEAPHPNQKMTFQLLAVIDKKVEDAVESCSDIGLAKKTRTFC